MFNFDNNYLMSDIKSEIEDMISDFKCTKENKERAIAPVSIWLQPEYKSKYDELQSRSDKKFGKLVQEILKKAIDSII